MGLNTLKNMFISIKHKYDHSMKVKLIISDIRLPELADDRIREISARKGIMHDILVKTCPYTINLVKHTVLFFMTILIIWFTIKFTEILFPNFPFAVKILLYISEVALLFHFARESMDDS